jgi:hypothetical protein
MSMAASAVLVTLLASAAPAQNKTVSFAGKWIVLDSASLGRGGRGGIGSSATVIQDANNLTIVRVGPMGEIKSIYKLDGSETKNTITMRGSSIEQTSKAMWMADTLMVTTSRLVNGATVENVMNLYYDKSGNLVVATTSPGRSGAPVVKQTIVYRKGG